MIISEIETLDLISQLGKELVTSYEAEDATISTIVSALLDFQVLTPEITVGTIDESYSGLTRSIKVDGDSILRALYRLRDTVGGYIYVDNDRQLQWASSIGENKGQQIRYRKNLQGIEREIDYSKLFNRIYAYGEGEGDARIKLSDAEGQTEDYVEDTDSQTEWGGIYPGVFVDRTITHPDTLLAWANLLLGDYKDPPIYYRIDTVDLSHSEELVFSFEALQLGSIVNVIDEDLGIDVDTIVVKIEHPDLLHPEQMTLELANRTKDITDVLTGVYDVQQLHEHLATKIGAGQVIVLGEFTVIDWVSEGTTNIRGDYLRTGVIQSNNWGEDAGSEFNLDDGTFRLGGSAAPALSWNGVELSLEGLYEGEWYDKSGVAIDATKGICIYGTDQALITSNEKWGDPVCYVGTDGSIKAAGGQIKLDADSIHIYGTAEGDYFFRFYDKDSVQVGRLGVEGDVAGEDAVFFVCAYPDTYRNMWVGAENGWLYLRGGIEITLDGNLIPLGDDAYDLGSASKQFAELYCASIEASAILALKAGTAIEPQADIIPNTDDAHDLGSLSNQFYGGYFKSRLKIPGGSDMYD